MSITFCRSAGLKRWIVFNCVGIMGVAVQMTTLLILTTGLDIAYLFATALSVEAAVLHNFIWHVRWTWSDRASKRTRNLALRLVYFNLANGALSIVGNLILMRIFVGRLGFDCLPANAFSIAICSIFNFFAGDRIVFRAVEPTIQKGVATMNNKSHWAVVIIFPLIVFILLFGTPRANGAELKPQTLKAWLDCVDVTEQRIAKEFASQTRFLALDFQDPKESADERQAVLSGEIPIRKLESGSNGDQKSHVPDGMIHHWRGSVFIAGVPLDFILARVTNPNLEDTRQEDVLHSSVLERSPGQIRLFLKLQRKKIVTVVYNTEHLVRFRQHGMGRASSSSMATKIAEIERFEGGHEQEKPQGKDSGFLWRMNSYWRYQQVPGGVIVECESMTLSRSIPPILEYMIRPIINKVARESMFRTLQSMRIRMTRSYRLKAGSTES